MSYQCDCPFLVPDTEEFNMEEFSMGTKQYPQLHQVDCEYADGKQ